jgi:hypothetical protein
MDGNKSGASSCDPVDNRDYLPFLKPPVKKKIERFIFYYKPENGDRKKVVLRGGVDAQ